MSAIQSLKSQSIINRAKKPMRNIPLQVLQYHLEGPATEHFVEGIDLSNTEGNKIKISLRAIDKPLSSGFERFELADFADKTRESSYVSDSNDAEAGPGVLIFRDCQQQGINSDEFTSSWVHSGIHNSKTNKERIEISLVSVDIFPSNPDRNRPAKAQIRKLLKNESEAFALNSKMALLDKIKKHMAQPKGTGHYIPEVIIRVIDNTVAEENRGQPGTFATTLRAPTKSNVNDEIPVYCTPEESLQVFLSPQTRNSTHLDLQAILKFCDDPENANTPMEALAIEVIPVERRNFGPETAKEFYTTKVIDTESGPKEVNALTTTAEIMKNKFNMRVVENFDGEERIVNNRMFTEAVFVLNKHKDNDVDYEFATKIEPLQSYPTGFNEKDVPTAFFEQFCAEKNEFRRPIRTEDAALTPSQLAEKKARQEAKQQAVIDATPVTQTQSQTQKTAKPATVQKTEASTPKLQAQHSETQSKAPKKEEVVTQKTDEPDMQPASTSYNDEDDFDDDMMEELNSVFTAPQPGM